MTELSLRNQEVLKAIIIDYINHGEPVGSRTVSKKYMNNISSATIRNIMSDLEELGYLYQPHTSAGRVPTEKGLRLYIESLMESRKIRKEEQDLIRKAYQDITGNTEEMLKKTPQILSSFCSQVGVVLLPRIDATKFKRIEFIKLYGGHILTILVSESGIIHQILVHCEEDISQEELDKYRRYLNDILKDLTLGEVKSKILEDMKEDKAVFDQLYLKTLEILQKAFSKVESSGDNVYIEGQSNLLNNPEFSNVERMKNLLKAFEDKSRIVRILDMAIGSNKGVQIILGPEIQHQELREISLVSSPYKKGESVLGVIGVIGPMRMDYPRIVPIVEFTATLISKHIGEPQNTDSDTS